jgi:shikimate dehydrogenase
MKYGLIGEHLTHSFSKIIHERLGYEYELCESEPDALDGFMKARGFVGINVTMPYKQAVIPYLDEIDEVAKEIGAVNTVVNRDGKLYGYNTDFYGMEKLFFHAEIDPCGKKVAILGSGGTSKTATSVLKKLGVGEIISVSRSGHTRYEDLYNKHKDIDIIVNTTPVGMFPDIHEKVVDISAFKNLSGVMDAVYNPLNTTIVSEARMKGIKAEAGLYMLVAQAIRASELFLDTKYPEYITDVIYNGIRAEKENIVLIGMPSSGKSSVGRLLAEKLDTVFVDTDEMIMDRIKMPIKDFFALYGEEKFREIESEVIGELAARGGLVIATGGGAILKEENVLNLRYNGKLLFIDRPIDDLVPTDSRPLSSDRETLNNLYQQRLPIYNEICDIRIEAHGTEVEIANNILENYL